MKKFLIGIGVVIVLLIVAIVVIPFVVPLETYKEQIAAQVEQATGRKLDIKGDLTLSLFPTVKIGAGPISFANAPGATPKNMLTLDRLDVEVALLPLLSKEVVVDRFVLRKPVIALEIDKSGKPNWQFGKAGAAAKPAVPSATGGGPGIGVSKLGDIRLVDGRLTFRNDQTGESQTLDDINMSLSLPSLESALDAKGAVTWRKEKIELTANVAKPQALMQNGASRVTAKIASAPVTFSYDGTVKGGSAYRVTGKLDLDVPSVRKAAAWAAKPIQGGGKGLERLKIGGELDMTPAAIAFTKAKITLDKTNADGDLRVALGGPRPALSGKLDVDAIDLNLYSEKAEAGAAKPAKKSAGWSTEPIDVSGLKAADADFALTVGSIVAQKIKIGKTALDLKLKGGVLDANLKQMQLYDGNGKARLQVDGSGGVPRIATSLDLSGFQAKPFLTDAMGLDRLSGKAEAKASLTTSGRSQKDMVGALGGSGGFKFTDGAIEGINLGAMVRNVSTAFLDKGAGAPQKTDFSELSGTFQVKNGILTNKDTKLLAPLLRLSAAGTVDLPKRTVDYRVEPKLVASTTGQGGKAGTAGISVPVLVSGPWDNISYKPDLAGLVKGTLQNPAAAAEKLKELKNLKNISPKSLEKALPGGSAGGALKNLFGR